MQDAAGIMNTGNVYQPKGFHQTTIKLQLNDMDKSSMDDLLDLKIIGSTRQCSCMSLVIVNKQVRQKFVYRKNAGKREWCMY